MTEVEWLESQQPRAMLRSLDPAQASDRKFLLLVCAERRARSLLDECLVVEAWADDYQGPAIIELAWSAIEQCIADQDFEKASRFRDIRRLIRDRNIPSVRFSKEAPLLIRDVFGNPYRPLSIDDSWLEWHDATVVKVAQGAYDERHLPSGHLDASRLAILADALEDAGGHDQLLLGHLRGPGPHVRGCWVVDRLLGLK